MILMICGRKSLNDKHFPNDCGGFFLPTFLHISQVARLGEDGRRDRQLVHRQGETQGHQLPKGARGLRGRNRGSLGPWRGQAVFKKGW